MTRLLDYVALPANLEAALKKVVANKGAPGVDGMTVQEAARRAGSLLPKLRRALLEGNYVPGAVRRVWIPKPGGGERGLGIPNVMDRVVQQALLQILEPVYERTFHYSSHGFRPGRGALTAVADSLRYQAEGLSFVVDIDLSKFFDRVHHQRLLDRLGQQVKDPRVLRLVRLMLRAGVVCPDGITVPTKEGTPQGGPLSPLLSNIVLDELDWEMKRRRLHFVRYADDFQVFVGSERAGKRVMAGLRRFIEGRMRLRINEEKSAVGPASQRDFLGFRIGMTRAGRAVVRLSPRSRKRIYSKLRELIPRNFGGSLKSCMARVGRYLRGWLGYFRLCTSHVWKDLRHLDCHIRRRLRAIVVRQKKRPRYLFRHLAKRISRRSAWKTAYSRRGPWWKSNSGGMQRAYPNAWFAKHLPTLETLHSDLRYDWRARLG